MRKRLMRPVDRLCELLRYDYVVDVLKRYLPRDGFVFDLGVGDGKTRIPILNLGHRWVGFDVQPVSEFVQIWDLSDSCSILHIPSAIILLDVIEN